MKITYNFGLLKNNIIGIEIKNQIWYNFLKDVKQTKNSIFFKFKNCTLEVNTLHFLHMKIEKNNNIICFKETNNEKFINGLFLYYMYNTQGLPIDILKDLLEDKGYILDYNGFNIMVELQKEVSKDTFINKNNTFY